MAWQALKVCPFYQRLGSLPEKQNLVLKLMEIFNERYRSVLWDRHQIGFGDIQDDRYYLGTDNFLKSDITVQDGINIGHTFPIVATAAPIMIAVPTTTTSRASPSTIPPSVAAVDSMTDINNDDTFVHDKERDIPAHIVDLSDSRDSDLGEFAAEMKTEPEIVEEQEAMATLPESPIAAEKSDTILFEELPAETKKESEIVGKQVAEETFSVEVKDRFPEHNPETTITGDDYKNFPGNLEDKSN